MLIKYLDESNQKRIKDTLNNIKSKYTKNNKESIMITEVLLKKNSYESFFNPSKKKDDLSDSFLQGLWFIEHNKT